MSKTYEIQCTWEVYGTYYIEAESLEEALQIAEEKELPEDGQYIDGSFEIDMDSIEYHNELNNADKKYLES